MILRSRKVNRADLLSVLVSAGSGGAGGGGESESGGGAGTGARSRSAAVAGGGVVGLEAIVVTNESTASDSTIAGRLPVAAAVPAPAAPPATVPMAAPLPPPAIPPIIAPSAAPPPILVALLFVCDSPLMTRGSTRTDAAVVPELTVARTRSSSPGSLSRPVRCTS